MTRFPTYRAYGDGTSDSVETSVNGVSLNTLAYNIKTRTGQHRSAGLRGANPVTPGKDGASWRPGKRREETALSWQMWASPLQEDGTLPADAAAAYTNWRRNMDFLLSLFDTAAAPIHIVQNGRECFADVQEAIDPQMTTGNIGEFTVEAVNYDAFWRDLADVSYVSSAGTGTVGLHSLTDFAGATAPMSDLVYVLDGPITDPKITDEASGHYCQYTGTVADGDSWTVNALLYTSAVDTTNVVGDTSSFGVWSPSLVTLSHKISLTAAPQIRVDGTSPGSNTKLTVTGRRKYR